MQNGARSSFTGDSPNLDLIRACAVACVFFAHLHDTLFGHSEITWHFGQMGVLIFFVHTSFVLMLSLERSTLDGPRMFASFYVRRAFRIYPLAMACVLVAFTLGWWGLGTLASNLALTTNLTYSENMVGGLWTLPIEVQMYVALPFLFVLGRSRPIWALGTVWLVAVPVALLNPSGRLNVLEFAPCFLAGVLGWRLSRQVGRRFGWWPLAFVMTWAAWMVAPREHEMLYRWAFCLALGLALPWFREIRFHGLTHIVAKYSYGIYLTHIAVMVFAFKYVGGWAAWPVFAVLAVAGPLLAYHAIEAPGIALGGRLAKRLTEWRARRGEGREGVNRGATDPTALPPLQIIQSALNSPLVDIEHFPTNVGAVDAHHQIIVCLADDGLNDERQPGGKRHH